MKLKITLPSSIKDLPEAQRRAVVEELQKALDVKASEASTPVKDEHNIWSPNDEQPLAEAEEELYNLLIQPSMEAMAELIGALGLAHEKVNIKKSLGNDFMEYEDTLVKGKNNGQHKISDLIELSKKKRQDFLKYVQSTTNWTKKKLAEVDRILKQKLPSYAQIAEEFAVRSAFLAKIRSTADTEALDTVGAFVDRFPSTIESARREGVVLTLKEKAQAEAEGRKVKILPLQPQELRTVANAELRTADKLTEVADKHRAGIKQLVLQAINGRWSSQQLAQALFDKFGDMNRDWRRVAITELAFATNDAYLAGCSEGDVVWVPPVEGSCRYCKQYLEGKSFIVTHDPKKMGNTYKQEMELTWIGKTNYGRKVATYIPCVPLHPHCRHRYHKLSRFYKVVDGKPVLKTSAELIQEERARRGLGPDPNLK